MATLYITTGHCKIKGKYYPPKTPIRVYIWDSEIKRLVAGRLLRPFEEKDLSQASIKLEEIKDKENPESIQNNNIKNDNTINKVKNIYKKIKEKKKK